MQSLADGVPSDSKITRINGNSAIDPRLSQGSTMNCGVASAWFIEQRASGKSVVDINEMKGIEEPKNYLPYRRQMMRDLWDADQLRANQTEVRASYPQSIPEWAADESTKKTTPVTPKKPEIVSDQKTPSENIKPKTSGVKPEQKKAIGIFAVGAAAAVLAFMAYGSSKALGLADVKAEIDLHLIALGKIQADIITKTQEKFALKEKYFELDQKE
jgi:hypothetical protein